MYPVGAPIGLAANFGELRPNHYHMGLDCKTAQRENMPVYAAAEGYVAKIKIEPDGFGRAIYINHPNGLTTVYGHLNNFFPELEAYVKQQQYLQQSWKLFIDVPANLFKLNKGDFIAFSGNTGGSQGPHTHFEIRDTRTDKVLNPLLFGFPLKDNVPPSILRLAVYDRNKSTYSQVPKLYPLKMVNGHYEPVPSTIVVNSDKVSFGISAIDKYSGSTNNNGIFEGILYYDGEVVTGFRLDSISYDETRYLNAHIDYRLKASGGPFVEHLSRLPGYPPGVYKQGSGDGVIRPADNLSHRVKIVVKDAYNNASVLEFLLTGRSQNSHLPVLDLPAYDWSEFYPGYVNVFEKDDIQLILSATALYDSFRFDYSKKLLPGAISFLHSVQNSEIPVHDSFTIRLKPNQQPDASLATKIIMERSSGNKKEISATTTDGAWFKAKFRSFGNFQLLIDTVPPVITAVGLSNNARLSATSQIAFIVKDNYEEIKDFRAELDGNWLRFTNDKELSFIYKMDEKCAPGSHELKVRAADIAGNITEKTYRFTR